MMREGCWLSLSALPSRRNSGTKTTSVLSCSDCPRQKPTGTVERTASVAAGSAAWASRSTFSTERVSKRLVSGS